MIWPPSSPLSWEPDTPHRLLHLQGEQTGSVSVSLRVGAAWRPREPAASFLLVPVLGRFWHQTPPSAQPSPVYSKQFSLLPKLPSHPSQTLPPRSPFARQDSSRTNAARRHQPPRHPCPLRRVPWELWMGTWVLGPEVGGGGCGGRCRGYPSPLERRYGGLCSDSVAVTGATAA